MLQHSMFTPNGDMDVARILQSVIVEYSRSTDDQPVTTKPFVSLESGVILQCLGKIAVGGQIREGQEPMTRNREETLERVYEGE
jgi:hypothetical protein